MNKNIIFRSFLLLLVSFLSFQLFAITSITVTADSVTCNGLNNGRVNVQVTGTPNYTYRIYRNNWPWAGGIKVDSIVNTSSSNVNFNNLSPARYFVIVDDQTVIPGLSFADVYEPSAFTVSSITIYKGLSCFNSCDGALKVSVTGGNKPYTFVWTRLSPLPVTLMADTDSILNDICQGTYQVVVNDRKNCGGGGILKSFPFLRTNPLARDSIPAQLAGGTVGTSQTICYNADVPAFTSSAPASGGSESFTYTWQYSTTSSTPGVGVWTDIPASNSTTWDYGTLTQTTYFVRKAVDPVCGTVYSNVITITVRTELLPGSVGSDQTICYNTIPAAFTSSVPASGGGGFTYQWQSRIGVGAWGDIAGATNPTYSVPSALTQTTDYRRAAVSTVGCLTVYSNIIVVTVYPQLQGGTVDANQSICYNTIPTAFTSSVPASGGGGFTYQWQSRIGAGAWGDIAGATNITYSEPAALTQTTDYRRAALSTSGCGTAYSNTITVTVYAQIQGGTVGTNQSICYNTIPAAFTSSVPASGGGGFTYQWQSRIGAGAWGDIAGATSATYSETSALTQTTDYRRAALSTSGCGTAYSNTIIVTVYPQFTGGTVGSDQTICYNTIPAAFTSSVPASGGGGFTYQWQSRIGVGAWGDIAGATNPTYSVPSALTQTTDYRRAAVSTVGCLTVYSNTIVVTVYAQIQGGTVGTNQSICYNTIPAAFTSSVPASGGGGFTYQWQSRIGAGAWGDIAGATNITYSEPAALTQTTDYRRAALSTSGCGTAYSNTITVTVYAQIQGGTVGSNQSICYNNIPAAFTSSVPASGGGGFTYQWQSRIGAGAWGDIAGATSVTYSETSALTQTTDYRRAALSTSGCGTAYSNTIIVTVYPQFTGGTVGSDQTICYNTIPAAFTSSVPASGGGTFTYQWQSRIGAGAWGNIAGATNATYTVAAALTQTTDYRRAALSTSGCGTVYSNTIVVTVYAQIQGGTVGTNQSICYNTIPAAFTSSVPASGGGGFTYQWQSKIGAGAWGDIAGATNITYSEPAALTQTTDYRRAALSTSGCGTAYSNTITVTVYAQIQGGTVGSNQSICYNTIPAAFTSSVPASGGGGFTYQWQSRIGAGAWGDIAGATSVTYSETSALTQTTDYRRAALSTSGCGTAYSNTIVVTVYAQIQGGTVGTNQSICYNTIPAAFTSSVPASGGGGFTYQWQSKIGAGAWGDIAGATNITYSEPVALTQTTDYRRAALSTSGCGTAYSNTITVTVYAQIQGGTVGTNQSICYNTIPVAFTSSVPASGGGGFTYQWQSRIGAGAWGDIAGATSATYSETSALTQTTDYRRAALSTSGCGTAYSNTIIVTVYPQFTGGTVGSDQTICYNTIPAAFTSSVPASGGGTFTYQWQSRIGAGAWGDISGATNATYTVAAALTQTTDYRRAALSTSGCGTAYSNTIIVTVYAQIQGGTVGSNQSICYNTIPAAFTSSVPASGGGGFTYQWQSRIGAGAWGDIAGATNITYSEPAALTQTTDYRRAALSTSGCGTAYSNTIIVTVYAQIQGGTVGSNQSICYNTIPAAFTSSVPASGGGGFTYQWQSRIGAGAWGDIAGATSVTYSETSALTQTTDYRRAALSTSGCGTAYSNTIIVTVYPQFTGGTVGSDQTICYNTIPAAFTSSVPASGGGTFTYQWQSRIGAGAWGDISGATNAAYTVAAALTQTTDYRRAALSTSGCGTVYSNTIVVTVEQPPTVNAGPDDTVCYISNFYNVLNASVTNSFSLQWSTPNGDGTFFPDNVLNTRYDFGTLDKNFGKGSEVELVISADGIGGCSSITVSDTMKLLIAPELLGAVGTPAPFIVGPNTNINVKIKVEDRNYLTDLSYYLVSPDDSIVVLKEAYDPLSYCNFGHEADLEFVRFPVPADTLDLCPGGGGSINLSGTFKATGNWNKLHGQDPANGIWKIVLKDGADFIYIPGPEDGRLTFASIELTDTNANGDTVVLIYESGPVPIPIDNTENSFIPVQTNFVVTLGLRTKCYGSCDATAVVTPSGGIGPYQILWSDGLGTNDIIDLCAGTYSVTITDALGCTAITNVEVQSPPQLQFNSFSYTDSMICGGAADAIIAAKVIGGTGRLTYTLLPGNIHSSEPDSGRFEDLSGGTYTLVVRDINNCSIDTTITIFEPEAIDFDSITINGITCNGDNDGIIRVTAKGGTLPYSFSISPGVEVNSDGIFTNLFEGSYIIGLTDANNCDTVYTSPLIVSAPEPLIIDTILIDSIACAGDSARLAIAASGGTLPYYISFTGGPDSIPIYGSSNLLLQPDSIDGKDADVSDWSPDTNYKNTILYHSWAWTISGDPSVVRGLLSFDLSSIPPGSIIDKAYLSLYSFIATIGGHSTMSGSNANVLQRIITPWDESTVTWNTQPSTTSQNEVTLPASTSELQHYPNIDVTALIQDMINEPDSGYGFLMKLVNEAYWRQMVFASSDHPDSTLHPKLEVFYSSSDADTFYFNVPAGNYDIVLYDANGCSTNWPSTITLADPPVITIDSIGISDITDCYGDSTGSIYISATGGRGNFRYSLNGGPTQKENLFSNLPGGNYQIGIYDTSGCSLLIDTVINQPSQIIITETITQISDTEWDVTLNVSGGTLPYLYYSIDNGATTQDTNFFENVSEGVHIALVEDSHNCQATDIFSVTAATLDVTIRAQYNASCYDSVDGGFLVQVLNGILPIDVLITDSITGDTLRFVEDYPNQFFNDQSFEAGIYNMRINDSKVPQQVYQNTFHIEQPAQIVLDVTVKDDVCNDVNDGSIQISSTGGAGNFTYWWADIPIIDSVRNNLLPGIYTFRVTDADSCNITRTDTIGYEMTIVVDITTADAHCDNSNDGLIQVSSTGGAGNFTYSWADNPSIIDSIRNDIYPGTYDFTIIDAVNCRLDRSASIGYVESVFTYAGEDVWICPFTEYTLQGLNMGYDSVRWYFHEDDLVFSQNEDIYLINDTSLNAILSTNRIVHPILQAYDNGCYGLDTLIVDVYPQPEYTFYEDPVNMTPMDSVIYLYEGDSYNFVALPLGYTYLWMPIDGLDIDSLGLGEINYVSDSVTYLINGSSVYGCLKSSTLTVILVRDIKIYNGFTPNGDGYSDTWIIDHAIEHGDKIEISVFNRWGERVFYSKGYNTPWDGTFKGKDLPIATYYYIIKVDDGKTKPITGSVTLLR